MKTRFVVLVSVMAGAALGGAAVQVLHAQAKPPAFVVGEIDVKNAEPLLRQAVMPQRGRRCGTAAAGIEAGGKYVAFYGGCRLDAGVSPTLLALRNNSTLEMADPRQPDRGDAGRHRPANFPASQSLPSAGFADKSATSSRGPGQLPARRLGWTETRRHGRRGARAALNRRLLAFCWHRPRRTPNGLCRALRFCVLRHAETSQAPTAWRHLPP